MSDKEKQDTLKDKSMLKRKESTGQLKLKDKKAILPVEGDKMLAVHSYSNKLGKDELEVTRGDVLLLLKVTEDTWWQAQNLNTKKKGWISSNIMLPEGALDYEEWCHGKITRNAAEYLLNKDKITGNFIVRESQSQPGDYTLSLMDSGKIVHYRINESDKGIGIGPSKLFPTVQEMIEYYKKKADGICCMLTATIPKAHAKPMIISKENKAKWELKRSDIVLGKLLGAGNFGEVYEGHCKGEHVAIKCIKDVAMELNEFIQEGHVMKCLLHPNIVRLLGVVFVDFPMYIVLEMCPKGDLLSYIRRREARKEIDAEIQLSMCSQVCSAMTHLERNKVIHRDLAARNCLVAEGLVIKLADFGMGREIDFLYTARTGTKMPVKWSAPEALCFNAFSVKSDVWSFGIILWEIVTLGDTPYTDIESADVLSKLEEGFRMPCPEKCNPLLYAIMLQTWEMKPENRPSFAKMMDLLVDIKTKEEIKSFPTSKNNDWKNLLVKKAALLTEIEACIPLSLQLSEMAYSRAQSIARFAVDESVLDDLNRLIEVLKGLVEAAKPLLKFPTKPLLESYKHIASNFSSLSKLVAKPVLAKIKPVVDDTLLHLKNLHLGLKEL